MELEGAVAVVTGGASGIGRALVLGLVAAGARGVVVCDLDEAGASAVATQADAVRPGVAVGTRCDVSVEADVVAGIDLAEERFGPVDLYCANAGVGVGAGPESPDQDWELAWRVNAYAHVLATRALLPGWLGRARGHLLVTASAAGLLSQIGSAPYSVSKHAAVAFAEWVSITYADQGVGVTCLCPQGVDTPLLQMGLDAGSPSGELAARVVRASGEVLSAEAVAADALEAVLDGRFLCLPHPEVAQYEQARVADRERWLAAMRRLQARA